MQQAPAIAAVHTAIEATQRLADLFLQRREQLARAVGLTVAEWAVVEEISGEHFMPSMFARRRDSTPAAVSKILRQLLQKGLIAVSIARDDGRQRLYTLTAKGRRTMAALRRRRQRAIEAIWMDLAAPELEDYVRFAQSLITRLETHAQREE
jgi:DNA-binding MarR family transcriptional regulator